MRSFPGDAGTRDGASCPRGIHFLDGILGSGGKNRNGVKPDFLKMYDIFFRKKAPESLISRVIFVKGQKLNNSVTEMR